MSALSGASDGKESACNAGDLGSSCSSKCRDRAREGKQTAAAELRTVEGSGGEQRMAPCSCGTPTSVNCGRPATTSLELLPLRPDSLCPTGVTQQCSPVETRVVRLQARVRGSYRNVPSMENAAMNTKAPRPAEGRALCSLQLPRSPQARLGRCFHKHKSRNPSVKTRSL